MTHLETALAKKLIRFENNGDYVIYTRHGDKRRKYTNPEEKVQLLAYLALVFDYKYPPENIAIFHPVTMGSETKEADIVVFTDALHQAVRIIVECKKDDITDAEFTQAVSQAFSYASALSATYVWVTNGIKNEYFQINPKRPLARDLVPNIPAAGAASLAPYKFAKNGGTAVDGQKLFPLEKISENELTKRFRQAHQSLWGGGELNPSEAFDELDKLIFCKIWDEREPRKTGEPYDFQIIAADTKDRTEEELLARLQKLYEKGRKRDPEVFKDTIRLSPAKARAVVTYLQDVNLSDTDLDSKGRAFETFMGSFFRGDFGQFFTPRPVVKFIVDALPINHESTVLDTSCGSGGFLLHALDKVRREADASFTPGTAEHFRHWHDFAEKRLYGIEINEQIARTAKMNMIIHDDGHTNVVACDGLLPDNEIQMKTGNTGFQNDKFDFIITNPPFGSIIKQTEKAYLANYGFAAKEADWLNPKSQAAARPNQDTEILFIEQCHYFLREGGYLAIVIPDGILTNSSLQYVRDQIEEMYRIVAVISLPQTTFTATGAGVKSSILFLKKYSQQQTKELHDSKQKLRDNIRTQENFEKKYYALEDAKKTEIKKLDKQHQFAALAKKERTANPDYAAAIGKINNTFDTQIEQLRDNLTETYERRRREFLNDYEIFMAIAEDIGYDTTGRPTKTNELDEISDQLAAFIKNIERGLA